MIARERGERVDWDLRSEQAGRRIAGLLERENPFGVFRMVPRGELQVDRNYQRPTSLVRARSIAYDFLNELFSPLWVADRAKKGDLYVVDGAHRLLAADIIGIDYMPELPCQIYATTGAKQEMQIYIWLQERRKAISSFQRFLVKLSIGDPGALAISEAMKAHGFELQRSSAFDQRLQDDSIRSIAALEHCYAQHGAKGLDDLLYVMRKAWDGIGISLRYDMLIAVMRLLEGTSANRATVATRLRDCGKDAWSLVEMAQRRAHNNSVPITEALRDVLARYAE